MRRHRADQATDEGSDQVFHAVARLMHAGMHLHHHRPQPLFDHGLLQARLVTEVVVNQRRCHARATCDVPQRCRCDALRDKTRQRRIQQLGAEIGGVHGRLAAGRPFPGLADGCSRSRQVISLVGDFGGLGMTWLHGLI
ncbi:hypothetical protein D3C81_1174980 [compost metagenome]